MFLIVQQFLCFTILCTYSVGNITDEDAEAEKIDLHLEGIKEVVIKRPKNWKSVEEVDIVRAYYRALWRHKTDRVPRTHKRTGKITVELKAVDCDKIGVGIRPTDDKHLEDTFVAMHMGDCRYRHTEL